MLFEVPRQRPLPLPSHVLSCRPSAELAEQYRAPTVQLQIGPKALPHGGELLHHARSAEPGLPIDFRAIVVCLVHESLAECKPNWRGACALEVAAPPIVVGPH